MRQLSSWHNDYRRDSQTFGTARESTVIKTHESRAMTTGQQVQSIGEIQPLCVPSQGIDDARPFLDVNVGQPKQVFNDSHEILGRTSHSAQPASRCLSGRTGYFLWIFWG